ncbi:TPA: hypothetical protein ACY3G5_001907 [Morganella morganii]|uniref:hypothetical protein n=1 Tax=Morganella TaxID=581 RepID=UPI0011130E7C|nr:MULTISPECIES: hypothetical protein [Morganella]MBT0401019.1 hypothetical protein [Morganella morganii subsp. morganii]HBZ5600304.1 hypothetical protein [Morganella morganii]HCR4002923.1 hypothetical protein [Morganella morganii]
MANPLSYIVFGVFVWGVCKLCEKYQLVGVAVRGVLRYLFCFMWPIIFFTTSLLYYGKRSEGMALLFAILGVVTSVAAVVVASNDPGKTYRAIRAFISRFF